MKTGYFKTAWSDVRNTPGWFGKLCLLSLLLFVPILGTVVLNGYLYGWARNIAWGMSGPMPKKIFDNTDNSLFSRGLYIWVLGLVCGILPAIISSVGGTFASVGISASVGLSYSSSGMGLAPVFSILGLLVSLVAFVISFFFTLYSWVGGMRIAIYGRISAGFQVKKVWAMIRKDTGGLLRILGMMLLLSFIFVLFMTFVYMLIGGVIVLTGFGIFGNAYQSAGSAASSVGYILAIIGIAVFVFLIFAFFMMVFTVWVLTLTTNALGYWTRNFNVAAWRGQEDPMPFELYGG
ncbi:MAG: DUF4013 domain-containing protein [Eggerthellaceae bacterium]|nr:DUF4013 domain-containing protein [Eggerthellaceae bacterium]